MSKLTAIYFNIDLATVSHLEGAQEWVEPKTGETEIRFNLEDVVAETLIAINDKTYGMDLTGYAYIIFW